MENLKLCTECNGRCCKSMGCHYSPEDFKDISYESLKKEIDKGHISLDWWEGNPFDSDKDDEIKRAIYLRTRHIYSPIVDPSYGGVCSLLKEDSCSLSYEERPRGGRDLIPSEDFINYKCNDLYNKQQASKDWYKYNNILEKLVDEYYKLLNIDWSSWSSDLMKEIESKSFDELLQMKMRLFDYEISKLQKR